MSKRISKSFALNANDLFAPWVPTTARNAFKQSPLYLPFLKVYSKTKLRCVEIAHTQAGASIDQMTVHIGLLNNFRVAYLSMIGKSFRACVYDTPDTVSRGTTHVGTSEKCMYLINRMLNAGTSAGATFDRAVSKATNFHNYIANNMGRLMTCHVREQSPTTYSVLSDMNATSVQWLLKRYFSEVAEIDIPSQVRNSIDKAYASLKAAYANNAANIAKLGEFFDREKWIFGYRTEVGYFLGAGHFKQTFDNYAHIDSVYSISDETDGVNLTMPIEYYRTFNDIPEDMRKSLLASVAMTKMYLEGGSGSVNYCDPERLIPSQTAKLLDANSCVDNYHGMGAYWMLVDRI